MSPTATSLSFVSTRHFEGSRGGRLPSRRHAVLRQSSHIRIGYPIHHFRGREPRLTSDPKTARCAVCRRAFPRRLDGLLISHKSNGDRCPGSLQGPGEDIALASWTSINKGLTPHGKRHGLKVWMDEDQIADVLKSERLGHDEPGMRGVYGHVSPAMREELKAALQARWEESLRQRAALSPVSAVPLLNRLLGGIQPVSEPVFSRLAPKIGHRESRDVNRRSPHDV